MQPIDLFLAHVLLVLPCSRVGRRLQAIYFGNTHWMQNAGDNTTVGPDGNVLDGPWVGADLEAGMYYGGGKHSKYNPQNKPLIHPFVSLYLRGRTDGFALKGGDATKGRLQTMYGDHTAMRA